MKRCKPWEALREAVVLTTHFVGHFEIKCFYCKKNYIIVLVVISEILPWIKKIGLKIPI